MTFSTAEELIGRIEAAFPDKAYRGNDACGCNCDECRELDHAIRDKPWTQFSPVDVRCIASGTSLYEPQAFAHILPAYMRASLLDPVEADLAVDFLAWKYIPAKASDKPTGTMQHLTREQQEILVDWLEWWVRGEEKTWAEFLAEPEGPDGRREDLKSEIRHDHSRYRDALALWRSRVLVESAS